MEQKNSNIFEMLNFKNYKSQLSIALLLTSRLMNDQYPSKELIKTYCTFFKNLREPKPSKERLKELENVINKRLISYNKIKIICGHKKKFTKTILKNFQKFRDEMKTFDDFICEKYRVVLTILSEMAGQKPWEENGKFLDEVNEYIKDKDLSEKELLGIYTKIIAIERKNLLEENKKI